MTSTISAISAPVAEAEQPVNATKQTKSDSFSFKDLWDILAC